MKSPSPPSLSTQKLSNTSAYPVSSKAVKGDEGEKLAMQTLHEQVMKEQKELLNSELRKVNMLESELQLSTAALSARELQHLDELHKAESDNRKNISERRTLVQKLQSIDMIEDAIRELYLQMKDRTATSGAPTPELLLLEKEELKSVSIVVILGHLHAIYKGLWAWKTEAEEDMRGSRARSVKKDNDGSLAHLKKIHELTSELRQIKMEVNMINSSREAAEEARERVLIESQAAIKSMAAQHEELLFALRKEMDLSKQLRAALSEAQEEGRRRDSLVMTNRQLESKQFYDRMMQDKDLRRLQLEHERQQRLKDIELREACELRLKVARLEEQLEDYKNKEKSRRKSKLDLSPSSLQPLFSNEDSPVGSVRIRPATAAAGAKQTDRFQARSTSMKKTAEALMLEMREEYEKGESARKDELTEAGNEILGKEYGIVDVNLPKTASRTALKQMRKTLDQGVEGMAAADYSGAPLATSALNTVSTRKNKSQTVNLVGQGDHKAKTASWTNTAATGLEQSRVKKESASDILQSIKNRIDAGLSPK